ncbi:MAG: hypothetical protein GXX10_06470 [Clostridiaceae bacterium]|nr:hypothetical protein [Clostridiaceae bacterium]
MDNSLVSQIKRGLKVTVNYFIALLIFGVFLMPLLSFVKDNANTFVFCYSLVMFLVMFYLIYVEMRVMAFKEKRPQYNINPSPFKGLLYGFIGIIPLIVIELVLIFVSFPEDLLTLKKRLYQGFAGPLYWFSSLIGNEPVHYVISFVLLVVIAFLGYYAGHKDFLLVTFVYDKLGIKRNKKTARREARKF